MVADAETASNGAKATNSTSTMAAARDPPGVLAIELVANVGVVRRGREGRRSS